MNTKILMGVLAMSAGVSAASGQSYDITSFTIDGGGGVNLASGSFGLFGTAGQPDAGTLSGPTFTVRGGFWSTAIGEPCIADFNNDGNVNFFDVAGFITAFNQQSPSADIAAPIGVLNFFDIAAFIGLFGQGCP